MVIFDSIKYCYLYNAIIDEKKELCVNYQVIYLIYKWKKYNFYIIETFCFLFYLMTMGCYLTLLGLYTMNNL